MKIFKKMTQTDCAGHRFSFGQPLAALGWLLIAMAVEKPAHGQSFYQQARGNSARSTLQVSPKSDDLRATANSTASPAFEAPMMRPPSLPPARFASGSDANFNQQPTQASTQVARQPPRDIFTQSASQPPGSNTFRGTIGRSVGGNPAAIDRSPVHVAHKMDQLSSPARQLHSRLVDQPVVRANWDQSDLPRHAQQNKSLFDTVSQMADSTRDPLAQANLETEAYVDLPLSDTSLDGVSGKFDDVKTWCCDKASAMFSGGEAGGFMGKISSLFGGADVRKIAGGLAVVIGGYLSLAWLLRWINPRSSGAIPREVLEVVGSTALNNRQTLQLVRLGSKLLLMLHGPDGTQSIGEVTDPNEVEHLLAMCGGRAKQASASIMSALAGNNFSTGNDRPAAARQNSGVSADDGGSSANQLLKALEKLQRKEHLFEA